MRQSASLKRIAKLSTDSVATGERLIIALENVESGTGRLVHDADIKTGVAASGLADVNAGDVLFGKLRPYLAKTWVADRAVFASTELMCLRPVRGVSSRWLGYVVASRPAIEWAVSTSDGSKMPRTSWEKFSGLKVTTPHLAEQLAIADHLDRETARIDALITAKIAMRRLLDERLARTREAILSNLPAPMIKLGRFVNSIGQGTSPQAEDRQVEPGQWGVLKLSAVKAGRFLPSEHKALSPETVPTPSLVPKPGDLLVTRANTPQLVGDVCAVISAPERLMLCDLIYVLRLSSSLDARFAAEALLTSSARVQLASVARGTSQSMVKLRGEDVKGVLLPVPPIEMQHAAIARIEAARQHHSRLDDALNRSIAALLERRQALITDAVNGNVFISVAA